MSHTDLLQPGEYLGDRMPITAGTADYDVYPVLGREQAGDTNVVLFDIPHVTELIHVRGDIAMQVSAVRGIGEVVIYGSGGQRWIYDLSVGAAPVSIRQGDIYRYQADASDSPLVVRDQCTPAFREGDESSLDYWAGGLTAGDHLVVWNPREPGERHLAGVLRVELLEEHDTSAERAERAGQSKFRGMASHWHVSVQRTGEEVGAPAYLRVVENTLELLAHGRAADMHIRPNAMILREQPQVSSSIDADIDKGS